MGTRSDWANVGRDFKKLGNDLGKTFVKTVIKGAKEVEQWANEGTNDNAQNSQSTESSQEPVAETTFVSEDK